MYVWIDGEKWAWDACPALTEQHGWMADPDTGTEYGRCLTEHEESLIRRALLHNLYSPELPFDA